VIRERDGKTLPGVFNERDAPAFIRRGARRHRHRDPRRRSWLMRASWPLHDAPDQPC
jgi:hypothetical protein